MSVLNIELGDNDANAKNIREYLVALLGELWLEQDAFSGKRPFGNSGWQYDLIVPLIKAGLVGGAIDEYGDLDGEFDEETAYTLVANAIEELGRT